MNDITFPINSATAAAASALLAAREADAPAADEAVGLPYRLPPALPSGGGSVEAVMLLLATLQNELTDAEVRTESEAIDQGREIRQEAREKVQAAMKEAREAAEDADWWDDVADVSGWVALGAGIVALVPTPIAPIAQGVAIAATATSGVATYERGKYAAEAQEAVAVAKDGEGARERAAKTVDDSTERMKEMVALQSDLRRRAAQIILSMADNRSALLRA